MNIFPACGAKTPFQEGNMEHIGKDVAGKAGNFRRCNEVKESDLNERRGEMNVDTKYEGPNRDRDDERSTGVPR